MAENLTQKLGFWGVVTFAMGPMLSSGIFLLPGLAFEQIGPSIIVGYAIATLLVVPALLSQGELATAMPKAGGTYYFIDRSLGPLLGTILGFGTWLSLAFKSAFDLIGLGVYLVLYINLPAKPVAIALCVVFACLSISGMKNVGFFQRIFVALVVGGMAYFGARGFFSVQTMHFHPFFRIRDGSLLEVIALVHVSFAGLTKVASIAEEVDDPNRNIPYGMITALGITFLIYMIGLIVMIGVIPAAKLSSSLTPVAIGAKEFMGRGGEIVMVIVSVLAFVASANAGITASSRYPLAMSRDNMISGWLKKISRFGTPARSTFLTMGVMIVFILSLSTEGVADLGSALLILTFGVLNLSVIVMRESNIAAYDPGFESPLYPWVQIIGIIIPVVLIPELGTLSMIVTIAVFAIGALWYFFYVSDRVNRSSAMYHVFKRVGMQATPQLKEELKGIVRERGTRPEDTFDRCIVRAGVIRHKRGEAKSELYQKTAAIFAERLHLPEDEVYQRLAKTISMGGTPIGDHVALPHTKFEEADHPELVIIHSQTGVSVEGTDELIYAIFVLISPMESPRQHLRFLAELANRAGNINFAEDWRMLKDEKAIRKSFFRDKDRVKSIKIAEEFESKRINELGISRGCIIAAIKRDGLTIVPHGDTVLKNKDRLILIGEREAVKQTENYLIN
jgi:amino acid transporter/mannitol/fructose-specific phosphotransferase system IIA component (Ntr-type)